MLKRFNYQHKKPFKALRETLSNGLRVSKRALVIGGVIAGLMAAPLMIETMREASKRRFNEQFFEWLPESQKWHEVEIGLAHVDCDRDAAQALKDRGQDPNGLAGLQYAIHNNICRFVMN